MDLGVCQHAHVRRQIEGEFDSMERLAEAIGCSRSTVSRFFSGKRTSLAVALMVLDKLKLTFDDVFTRRGDEDGRATPSGGSAASAAPGAGDRPAPTRL
jgi:transcriptional regulator with XRE-family HTH domain